MKDEYVSKESVLEYIRKAAETAYGDCEDAIGDAYNYLADDLEMNIIRPSIVNPPEGEYISKKKAVSRAERTKADGTQNTTALNLCSLGTSSHKRWQSTDTGEDRRAKNERV